MLFSGYRVEERHSLQEDGCVLVAVHGVTTWGWGHWLRVSVRPEGSDGTKIDLLAVRRVATNVTEPSREREIVTRLCRELALTTCSTPSSP